MNNNDNKKSTELWAHRLFEQFSAPAALPRRKTNFVHRYHDVQSGVIKSPFRALFSGSGQEQTKPEPDTSNFQQLFGLESLLSESIAATVEPVQTRVLKLSQVSAGGFNLSSDNASGGQFAVVNLYDETPDVKTFRLVRPDRQLVDYFPGQYMTLSIMIAGQEFKRSYSLASSPSRPRVLEITIKRDPGGGVVSNWLNDHLKIGDKLNMKGPYGKFSCVNQTSEKVLFLAAGSGIVPVMSMLRWLADTDAGVDVLVLLSFRNPEDIIYRDELELIAARHKNINPAITLTTEAIVRCQWAGLTGRVNEKMIAELAPDLPERTVYLCGPDAFMAECKKNLLKLKLPAEKLFCESFTVNSPMTTPGESGAGRPSGSKTGSYRVSFVRSGKTIAADGQLSLLELAERSGVVIHYECRSGQCGECMVKCLKGRVLMTDEAEIDGLDRKKGWIYACCAYPASNIELDI